MSPTTKKQQSAKSTNKKEGFSADEKAALWLLGWSYVHPRAQRREANAHLAALTPATPRPPTISRRLRVVP